MRRQRDGEEDMTDEEKIRANAELVNEQFSAPNIDPSEDDYARRFGYNYLSVLRIEQFIEGQRTNPGRTPQATENLVEVLGSWLGECILSIYPGAWRWKDNQLGVFFDDNNAVFPFEKVRKQFEQGVEGGESILDFFRTVNIFYKRIQREAEAGDPES